MNTETFRAPDMMAALETIQQKLGPEAMVLSVREIFDESVWKIWKKPGVEVMAGVKDEHPADGIGKSQPAVALETLRTKPAAGGVMLEPGQGIYGPQALVKPSRPTSSRTKPVLETLRASLDQQGILPDLQDELLQTCREVLPPQVREDPYRVESYLQDLISGELESMPEIQIGNSGVICLTGSGGSGKTSTIAKLAAKYTQEKSRDVVWISADTFRAGAIAEAQAYTETLKIPYHKAYTPAEFSGLIDVFREDYLVLADLFDCNPRCPGQVEQVKEYLAGIKSRDVYLVIAATTQLCDVSAALDAYQGCQLQGILPTKLDETGSYGPIISAAWASKLPLVYCTAGPSALDELKTPEPEKLARNIKIS